MVLERTLEISTCFFNFLSSLSNSLDSSFSFEKALLIDSRKNMNKKVFR